MRLWFFSCMNLFLVCLKNNDAFKCQNTHVTLLKLPSVCTSIWELWFQIYWILLYCNFNKIYCKIFYFLFMNMLYLPQTPDVIITCGRLMPCVYFHVGLKVTGLTEWHNYIALWWLSKRKTELSICQIITKLFTFSSNFVFCFIWKAFVIHQLVSIFFVLSWPPGTKS